MHDPDGYGKELDDLLDEFSQILRAQSTPSPRRKPRPAHPKYRHRTVGGGKIELKTKRVTQEEAVRRVNENYSGELEVISKYSTRSLPLRVKCLVCNVEFSTRAENLFRGKYRACNCK